MHPTVPTPRSAPARRTRPIAAGAVLIALMLLAVVGPALAPTPAYAANDLFRLNADVTVGPGQTYTSVVVMNGTIDVYGHVDKDAFAANGDIIVHDGGFIGGDAVTLTGKVTAEGSGTIGGERVEVGSGAVGTGGVSIPTVPAVADNPTGSGLGGWIVLTLGALGLGLLLVLISGDSLHAVGHEISARTGRTVLVGFLALVGVPIVFVVLLISVIGIPVALLLILLVPLCSLYGMFALALVVGERFLVMFDRAQAKDVWAMVAGVLLIGVIRLIPVLGWIAFAAAGLVGFGATVSRLWDYFQQRRAARPGPGQTMPPYPMDPYPTAPYPMDPYPTAPYPAGPYPAGQYAPPVPYPPAGYPAAYGPAAYPPAPDAVAEVAPTEVEVPPAGEAEAPAGPAAEAPSVPEPEAPAVPEAALEPANAEPTVAPGQPTSEPRFHL